MPIIPNAENAYIPLKKLCDYALDPDHPVGKHKAIVFEAVFGLTFEDTEELADAILSAILENEAVPTLKDKHGQRFEVVFPFEKNGQKAPILTAWIIDTDADRPRLTSCYVIKKFKKDV